MTQGQQVDVSVLSLPEQRITGYADVLSYLRREMLLGRLRAGDRLPSERKLSEHLGVARDTLRQALRVLEGNGSIVVQRGSRGGAIVQSARVDFAEALEKILEHHTHILHLLEYRTIIEPAAAQLAAQHRTTEQLAEIELAHIALSTAKTLNEGRDHDTAFHLAIAAASGNPELARAVEDARVKMFHAVDVIDYEFIRDSSFLAHERIFEAIRDGAAADAAKHMCEHLATTRHEFTDIITRHTAVDARNP